MKKIVTLLVLFACIGSTVSAQLNMVLRDQLNYNQDANDIWGYVAPDSTEYALVGLRNGVSIVSLADPDNIEEVGYIDGEASTWRDIKTWGEYAYVVTDQNGTTEGITIIDLTDLPNSVSAVHYNPYLDIPVEDDTLETCHNIYIDEFGYAYLAGCNVNGGGMVIFDVDSADPFAPTFVAPAPPEYAHDVFVRNNLMYASEIFNGVLAIYDVEDKDNITFEGATLTPREFTHNAWLSDDSEVIFTTDERANAPVAAYDISDPNNIIELDQFRPVETLGSGVIPHNVHVWEDWLIISYYTDGVIVVDGSRPDNLIEVGNLDTFLGNDGGFSGAWGAYPFLPSGLVLVSDINNGLFVVSPTYVRAAWLEGVVTDAVTTNPLAGVRVVIDADQANLAESQLGGDYATGLATAGTYNVTFSAAGYQSLTTTADLTNGEVTELDVALQPLPEIVQSGIVRDAETGAPIANAQLRFIGEFDSYSTTTSDLGEFTINSIFATEYDVYVGAWGYQQLLDEDALLMDGEVLVYELNRGYEDDFIFDLGWTTDAPATEQVGLWVRGVPNGTTNGGNFSNPNVDVAGDFGNEAYVTGNSAGGGAGLDDVDGGPITLTTPYFDLTGAGSAELSYYKWFFNAGGQGTTPNDEFSIFIESPDETVELEVISNSTGGWQQSVFDLVGLIELRDSMRVIFETSDDDPGHLVEAGVDVFRIESDLFVNTGTPAFAEAAIQIAPNPSAGQFNIQYAIPTAYQRATLEVVNVLGQPVERIVIDGEQGQRSVGASLETGVYLLRLNIDGRYTQAYRLLKVD